MNTFHQYLFFYSMLNKGWPLACWCMPFQSCKIKVIVFCVSYYPTLPTDFLASSSLQIPNEYPTHFVPVICQHLISYVFCCGECLENYCHMPVALSTLFLLTSSIDKNLSHNFTTMRDRTFIFHMCIHLNLTLK